MPTSGPPTGTSAGLRCETGERQETALLTPPSSEPGLSLYEVAREMNVEFSEEAVPEERYVRANGLRFHYLDWGQPASPPVLMLHGFAQICHSWDFIALSLCDRFRVLAFDGRGHGDTEWPPDGDYSMEAQQRDLQAVIQALSLENVTLMGLSMGGRHSFIYAARHPDEVRSLLIVEAAPEHRRSAVENIRRFVQSVDELDSIDEFVKRVRVFNQRRSEQQIRGSLQHNLKQLPSGKWTWKYDKALRSPSQKLWTEPDLAERLWSYLADIRCPTLVVRGAESNIVSQEMAEAMRERIPDCRLATIENAGHLVPGDNPSGLLNVVGPFLDGLG